MALEPGGRGLSISPTSSGRASPAPRNNHIGQRGRDDNRPKDKAFRRYAIGVERALSLFDTAFQDWADYISFLGRLLKSLQAHPPNCTIVPLKYLVAKRLSQCLSPDLPSGVHQKAIELYAFIFALIGRDSLSEELSLYLPGLSPTLSFASLSVKSLFLNLLETHFLKLESSALRPALKALILTLLPGLEEETSDDFEKTLRMIDGFKLAIQHDKEAHNEHTQGDEYFWQCFFLAAITSKSRRLGALAYLTRYLPKLGKARVQNADAVDNSAVAISADAAMVTSPEPGLLLRCFAAGLGDDQILIQRGFLDLLVTHLPLDAPVLQTRVKQADLELLMMSASGVVARRDMSLNRRLWSWLLGPETTVFGDATGSESPLTPIIDPMADGLAIRTQYFEKFGLRSLIRALLSMLSKPYMTTTERARPYRICLSLMDRWEIGGLVVPQIFMPVINSVRRYESRAASKEDFLEVLRSASVFFDGVESGLIWGELLSLITDALQSSDFSHEEKLEKLLLVRFILMHFNVKEEEMLLVHAPRLTLAALAMLNITSIPSKSGDPSQSTIAQDLAQLAINVIGDLVDLVPERAYQLTSRGATETEDALENLDDVVTLHSLKRFYVQDQGNLDIADAPLSVHDMTYATHKTAGGLVIRDLKVVPSSADVAVKIQLLVKLLSKTPQTPGLPKHELLTTISFAIERKPSFETFASITTLVISLLESGYILLQDVSSLMGVLVNIAWLNLSPTYPKYHVETARILWQLQGVLTIENHELEAALCAQIIGHNAPSAVRHNDADPCQRFSILWGHVVADNAGNLERRGSKSLTPASALGLGAYATMLGRPLFILLDALSDERTQLCIAVKNWLQDLSGLDKLFHLFIEKLTTFGFLRSPLSTKNPDVGNAGLVDEDDDVAQCLYYLQTFSNILTCSSPKTWTTLAQNSLSTAPEYDALYRITAHNGEMSLLEFFTHICLCAGAYASTDAKKSVNTTHLHRIAFTVLYQILVSPSSAVLRDLHLEHKLIELLHNSIIVSADDLLQISLLDVAFATLQLSRTSAEAIIPSSASTRRLSIHSLANASKTSLKLETSAVPAPPPAALINCLQVGLASKNCRSVLDSWISFLAEVLPFYSESIFQVLIPLVNTLCKEIALVFGMLQATFNGITSTAESIPETTLISLINGLEQVLARGHERLIMDESHTPHARSPEQAQGFFGNMVSGVFASDSPATRSQNANNRLTVLLSFQDAIRISYSIWSWGVVGFEDSKQDSGSMASFLYTSLRMRNRARRLLEHLFAAEALECLETVVEIWQRARISKSVKANGVFNLLHVLNGSRPKYTLPAIFDAIYSRTNPAVLEFSRRSTLTTSLRDTDLVTFLVSYARSIEDDAMDEIWQDCMTFLKDILTNPFPHRQILPDLLEFISILGQKVDNTNFGEQKKMRRELGDLFLRLLTASFTTSPISFTTPSVPLQSSTKDGEATSDSRASEKACDIVDVLATIAPTLQMVLVEPDRILSAASAISVSIISPTIRSKSFPENVTQRTLDLLYQLARLPGTQKAWKRDLSDAFNDSRFFANSVVLVEASWLPLLRQWLLSDKDRMSELLSRLTPPTTAGIVFGVGAASARLEADRKTQLNLRRIATIILASATDHFVTELAAVEAKLVELLAATSTSSPSSVTRAEIFMVLHALVLKISPIHLAPLWPIVNAELHSSISSIVGGNRSATDMYSNHSILQACRLLDVLLCISPDDFQLHEWLYITDTIDAVYRPTSYHPVGLIDELSEELDSAVHISSTSNDHAIVDSDMNKSLRRPLLVSSGVTYIKESLEQKEEFVARIMKPFFNQLSIYAFERTYEMGDIDWKICRETLLADLFNETGIVKTL